MRSVLITAEVAGKRLDTALAVLTGESRHQVQKAIQEGRVRVAGQLATTKQAAEADQEVEITEAETPAAPDVPDLKILYEDEDVLIVDKPAGLAVHPTESGRLQPTVAAFARAHGVEDEDLERPGIVHRLDKETSGVLVLAKHPAAKVWLQKQFKDRLVAKSYLALVRGRLDQPEATINLPIGRDRKRPVKRAVVPGGRDSVTGYKVVREYPGATLVEVDLQTGRTHQIRVHFAHLGHPVVGDSLYGESKLPEGLMRQFLHAASLTITLPSGAPQTVTSPLPPDLSAYLRRLEVSV